MTATTIFKIIFSAFLFSALVRGTRMQNYETATVDCVLVVPTNPYLSPIDERPD